MDTEENGGKERRNLARDLFGHADPTRRTAAKGVSQASEKHPGLFSAQSRAVLTLTASAPGARWLFHRKAHLN